MSAEIIRGVIENRQIKLSISVKLSEKAMAYVIIPDGKEKSNFDL